LNAAGQIIGWNEEAIRINGYSAREIVGKHFSVLYPTEDIRKGKPRAPVGARRSRKNIGETKVGASGRTVPLGQP